MNKQKEINSYIARQKAWIKANDVKPGDTVLVLKEHNDYSKGWSNSWSEDMEHNKIATVVEEFESSGISLNNYRLYPYTTLLKLQGKPEDYRQEEFYWKDQKHICWVTNNSNESDFFYQKSYANDIPRLRKNNKNHFIIDSMHHIYDKKGYYPASSNLVGNFVVASTLTGIGLPIIRL